MGARAWEQGRGTFVRSAQGWWPSAGPWPGDTGRCGACIVDVPVEEAIRLMDDDPGVQAGILTYEVHPMRSFPGSALP